METMAKLEVLDAGDPDGLRYQLISTNPDGTSEHIGSFTHRAFAELAMSIISASNKFSRCAVR